MRTLSTPRLHLVPVDADLVRRREEAGDEPEVLVDLPDGARTVTLGDAWPDPVTTGVDTWLLVEREGAHAIGRISLGDVEDGVARVSCDVVDDARGRGLGTEAVGALVDEALASELTAVRSETRSDDIASQRVLENTGFTRTGSSDGAVHWRRDR